MAKGLAGAMGQHKHTNTVAEIMASFAERTGLSGGARQSRRYLWTDAFAVCNFLELHRRTGSDEPLRMARALIDAVHTTLGRHRPDDARGGWISGLSEKQGRAHPTRGGLRIGKVLGERVSGEPFDGQSEWDRDGQYFHYLTKWMHALARAGRVLANRDYISWGIELARTAHARFAHWTPEGGRGLYWKMSIDLSRPLVPSAGHHDPLDGFITFDELEQAARTESEPELRAEIEDLRSMCSGVDWTTADPLGLGGLLCDAYRIAQLIHAGPFRDGALLTAVLSSSASGLTALARRGGLAGPAAQRLAFRELGLSIGLQAVQRLAGLAESARLDLPGAAKVHITELRYLASQAEQIHAFWLDTANRATSSWKDHLDINTVMLATSLAPDGFLSL